MGPLAKVEMSFLLGIQVLGRSRCATELRVGVDTLQASGKSGCVCRTVIFELCWLVFVGQIT